MLSNGVRVCDVCGEEIARGTKYRAATLQAAAAQLFLAAESEDLAPTWRENPDGTISLDVCLTCCLSMGNVGDEQSN